MRSTRLLISLTLSIGLAKGIAAQAHGATTAGSFTDAQSLRGRRIFGAHCASCHGAELEGAIGPALAGSTFRTKWNGGAGRSTAELFHLLSTTMPKPAMGSLAPAAYLDVLAYLLHQRGRVVSQGELTEHIHAPSAERDSNTVEVFIARLRRKLGGSVIETVRGLGYRIEVDR